jgi:hydrogenase large subunit
VEALFSTLGRTAARGLDAALGMIWLKEFFGELMGRVKTRETSTFNGEKWEPSSWAKDCQGVGLVEAPRGALAHWIKIKDGKIDNYQLVVPTTWNGSPRDGKGQHSSFEASLIGTPVANLEQPVEIIRTIHSFDPCLACAVHLYDPEGRHLTRVSFE